jgi:hypothetical protein
VTFPLNGESLVESGFQSLREFALFGGNADATPNSGFMIDQVTHPRIDMAPGMTLNRGLRLTFGYEAPLAIEAGNLSGPASLPVMSIDGIGERYSEELGSRGVTTLADLATLASGPLTTEQQPVS